MYGLLPRYRQLAKLEKRQVATGNKIVLALSKAVARDYAIHYRLPPEAIRLIYNGVDTTRFCPNNRRRYRARIRKDLQIAPDEMLVLFVGNDYFRKGLPTAIRAIRALADSGAAVRMVVVGAQRRGASATDPPRSVCGPNVTHMGRVPEALPYYAAADVFVLPTLYDPCSLSVLEALATGLPCVTTVFNGVAELIRDGVEGYVLADPTNHRLLAARLRLLMDPHLRLGMGKAARRLALRHSIEHNSDEILGLYNEILAERFPPVVKFPSGDLRREFSGEMDAKTAPGHSDRWAA
jgi:UDP-glucose:(heptosyl)LPS alpha-1,3-glucosyltransferase